MANRTQIVAWILAAHMLHGAFLPGTGLLCSACLLALVRTISWY